MHYGEKMSECPFNDPDAIRIWEHFYNGIQKKFAGMSSKEFNEFTAKAILIELYHELEEQLQLESDEIKRAILSSEITLCEGRVQINDQ